MTMKPMIEYSPPENGLKAGNTSAIRTPVTPASPNASAKARADSRTMFTPTIWIASRFIAAARSTLGSVRAITRQLEDRPADYLLGLEPTKEFTP